MNIEFVDCQRGRNAPDHRATQGEPARHHTTGAVDAPHPGPEVGPFSPGQGGHEPQAEGESQPQPQRRRSDDGEADQDANRVARGRERAFRLCS